MTNVNVKKRVRVFSSKQSLGLALFVSAFTLFPRLIQAVPPSVAKQAAREGKARMARHEETRANVLKRIGPNAQIRELKPGGTANKQFTESNFQFHKSRGGTEKNFKKPDDPYVPGKFVYDVEAGKGAHDLVRTHGNGAPGKAQERGAWLTTKDQLHGKTPEQAAKAFQTDVNTHVSTMEINPADRLQVGNVNKANYHGRTDDPKEYKDSVQILHQGDGKTTFPMTNPIKGNQEVGPTAPILVH